MSFSPSAEIPFIVSSNIEKVDPVTRKLIRSHVMRGKKQNGVRQEKKKQRTTLATSADWRAPPKEEEIIEVIKLFAPMVPGRVGSDLSLVEFAADINPAILLNMAKVCTVAKRVIFPLMVAIGVQEDNRGSFSSIALDAALLHITASVAEGFLDRILRRRKNYINTAATLHLQKGLRLLRDTLLGEDEEKKVSDTTISVVLKLAQVAHFDGDHQASKQHMAGLRRIVDLRGGLNALNGSKLVSEMLRCDLSIALLSSTPPVFFLLPSERVSQYPEKLLSASDDNLYRQDDIALIQKMNGDLATSWQVLKRFCLLVNLGTQTQRLISPEIIHGTMTAVIYRLLHMSFPTGSIDATVHLGLLAFSHHVFLQWQDIRPPYYHFPDAYKNSILGLKSVDGISRQLTLWLLMVGANSLFYLSDETWMRELLRESVVRCQAKTWKEVQEILKSYMWIPLLDEEPGKRLYDSIYSDKETD
ncbi:hypothetical protein BJ875DRAFT_486285 [Amylocarpus encephaloides]|uniref:Uncharacterized protein n=1 Tax=Amylocarpus encephaloides TaxID=45428 RepID=A0A9P8C4P4_9HELO|nr:hypothetical protein BJ875DRAFT_486285 [Amylocarpus encephaloides]